MLNRQNPFKVQTLWGISVGNVTTNTEVDLVSSTAISSGMVLHGWQASYCGSKTTQPADTSAQMRGYFYVKSANHKLILAYFVCEGIASAQLHVPWQWNNTHSFSTPIDLDSFFGTDPTITAGIWTTTDPNGDNRAGLVLYVEGPWQ